MCPLVRLSVYINICIQILSSYTQVLSKCEAVICTLPGRDRCTRYAAESADKWRRRRITDRRERRRRRLRPGEPLSSLGERREAPRYNTHIDLPLAASAHWPGARRCAGFQRATPYKTVTGVTARYQQVMPKKEEDTPSSGISSSVSLGRPEDGDLISLSPRAPRIADRQPGSAGYLPPDSPGINARGSRPLGTGGMREETRARSVDESRGESFDRSMI